MNEMDTTKNIQSRFQEVEWHDSRLRGVDIHTPRAGAPYKVRLLLDLIVHNDESDARYQPASLSFLNCRFARVDSYLYGMALCGGDISCALAFPAPESDLVREIQADWAGVPIAPEERLDRTLHFLIEMTPPGGQLDFIADDFELKPVSDGGGLEDWDSLIRPFQGMTTGAVSSPPQAGANWGRTDVCGSGKPTGPETGRNSF